MKNNILKALKVFIYVVAVGGAVGFIYHFIGGILGSLFADDVITQQNRIEGAYQFIYMACSGVIMVVALYLTRLVKVDVLPEAAQAKIKAIFTKKTK